MTYDPEKHEELEAARVADGQSSSLSIPGTGVAGSMSKDTKDLALAVTPIGFLMLLQANLITDWPYALALFAAIFKDMLNFLELTGFLYFVVVILTFCCSIFIFLMMLLASFSEGGREGRKKGRVAASMLKRGVILIIGTTAELLPGVNFIPWEVITVLIIYSMVLITRKQIHQEEKRNQQIVLAQSYADEYEESEAESMAA